MKGIEFCQDFDFSQKEEGKFKSLEAQALFIALRNMFLDRCTTLNKVMFC